MFGLGLRLRLGFIRESGLSKGPSGPDGGGDGDGSLFEIGDSWLGLSFSCGCSAPVGGGDRGRREEGTAGGKDC